MSIVTDDDRESGRTLVLDDLDHSYIDLQDPTHLEFWYTRRFADVIELLGPDGPADVVHIGGGALTVPSWLQATEPDSEQVVFEIDGELVDLVVDEFDRSVGRSNGLDVVVGDGRLSLAELDDDSVDVVIGDAFGSRAVPWHLATEEFVADIQRVLRPDGDLRDQRDRLRRSGLPARRDRNDPRRLSARGVGAGRLGGTRADRQLGDRGVRLADRRRRPPGRDRRRGDEGELVDDLDGFVGSARVLTDDFAPVDQLLAHGR